jgi:hypothetical protein
MRKNLPRFDTNLENFKRRRALPALGSLSEDARFFERILNIRKMQEMVFVTKAAARTR